MADWQAIMGEMDDYNRRERHRKIDRLKRDGIESIISDYNKNIFDFNNLVTNGAIIKDTITAQCCIM